MRGVSRHRGRAIPQPKGTEIQRRGQQTGDDANSLNCVATGGEPSKDAEYRVCGTRASKRGDLHPKPQAVSKRRWFSFCCVSPRLVRWATNLQGSKGLTA